MSEKVEYYRAVVPKRNAEWRGTEIKINEKKLIGRGGRADVYEVTADVAGKVCTGVIKEYKNGSDEDRKWFASRAMDVYKKAREVNLPVFPTFRIEEGGEKIFMSNGNTDEIACVAPSNVQQITIDRAESLAKSVEITNIEPFCKKLKSCYENAVLSGMRVRFDSYFFLINHETDEIDFLLGDLEDIDIMKTHKDQKAFADERNRLYLEKEIRDVLHYFFQQFYPTKSDDYYRRCLDLLGFDKK